MVEKWGPGEPTYIIAELSANHNQDFDEAVKLLRAAADSGADAVKLQTYTADTLTIDCDSKYFKIEGTVWDGKVLYDLYKEAYTPWDWQPKLQEIAKELGVDLFSTPFDFTAVEFLEKMDTPVYKIASSENVDLPLLKRVAETGRPIIMSTGLASLAEIEESVRVIRENGGEQLALLHCVASYPADPEDMRLRTIPYLAETFNLPSGLSDHSLDLAVPVSSVALGASLIEKHFTLSRSKPGPDSEFSLEPKEFKEMVQAVRTAEKALGRVSFERSEKENITKKYRRSIFVVKDMKTGDEFSHENLRVIRPGFGLHSRHLEDFVGKKAGHDIKRGEPLSWAHLGSK